MNSPTQQIRILIVDDHALFREGLARLLGAEPDFKLVDRCGSATEALQIVAATPVDVVLLDLDLDTERGAVFMRDAGAHGFQGRVLIVTANGSTPEAAQLLSQGASGIFLKHNPPELLAEGIRAVMRGEAWVDQRYLKAFWRPGSAAEAEYRKPRLSDREKQVLRDILGGLTNKEIAEHLQVSESSVKAALQSLFDKTEVRTRSQLVRIALEHYRDQV